MNPAPDPYPPNTPAQNAMYPIHGITLTIIWCLAADALLIVVRYYKNWHKYLLVHSLFTIIAGLTVIVVGGVVIVDRSYLFNWPGFSTMALATQIHFLFGMVFTAMIVGITILGLIVKKQIENIKDPPERIAEKKRIHRIVGYCFYFSSKAQLVLGWYVNGSGGWTPMMTVLLVYYAVFFSARFAIFDRLFLQKSERLYRSFYSQKPAALQPVYESITEMIENGVSLRAIRQDYPDTRYVMFKDRLYDVSGLLHPGGMFIIENVIGEEISRYLLGAYGLEITKSLPHKHSIYAMKLLDEMYMNQLDFTKMGLLKPLIGEKINVATNWKLEKTALLSKDMSVFEFSCDRYHLYATPGILYLGRHFILQPVDQSLPSRLYTLTLCMSSQHRAYVKSILQALGNMETEPVVLELPQSIQELPFVIKQYKVGGFSQYIHSLTINGSVRIEGPFGRGLELEDGNFYAFCGGTGVLPLLDLVYEILLEVYRRATKSATPSRLPDKFKLSLYLSVNTQQDLKGLDIIPQTYKLSEKYKVDMFKLFVRVSKGSQPSDIPRLESRLDQHQLARIVNGGNITTALVCGSPQMNNSVGSCLIKLIGKERVHIL